MSGNYTVDICERLYLHSTCIKGFSNGGPVGHDQLFRSCASYSVSKQAMTASSVNFIKTQTL